MSNLEIVVNLKINDENIFLFFEHNFGANKRFSDDCY
jgi:hypothetical protein